MDLMAEMLKRAASRDDDDDWKCLTDKEVEVIGGFKPIENLQPGDKLKPRSFYKNSKTALNNDVVTVWRVVNTEVAYDRGDPVDLLDFTILIKKSGNVVEVPEDSRQWMRA